MVASSLLNKIGSIEEWLTPTTLMKQRNTVLSKKKGSLRLNIVTHKEKKGFFGTTILPWITVFLMSFYFTKIFVDL